jgi:hypothetical protein
MFHPSQKHFPFVPIFCNVFIEREDAQLMHCLLAPWLICPNATFGNPYIQVFIFRRRSSIPVSVPRHSKPNLCCDWRSVGQPVLVSSPHLGPETKFLLLSDSCGFVHVVRPLWREDGSVVYNCCWFSTAQLFSGPSPAGFVTTFYCHRFETHLISKARSPYLYPPGTGWQNYIPRPWFPLSSPPMTLRAMVELF